MATVGTAIQALLTVGSQGFVALKTTPRYGDMYRVTRWIDQYDFESYTFRTVSIYETMGQYEKQGLGYSREWLYQNLTLDIYQPSSEEARLAFQKLRELWFTDFDYPGTTVNNGTHGDGTVTKGYLRQNGIKRIIVGPDKALPIERGQTMYRRVATLTIEIGD
jgi:hypothetical protein